MTAIELCNAALIKLGADDIASFDGATPEAKVASRLYPLVRDAVLCSHPWSFAVRKASLPLHGRSGLPEFAHDFQLPRDFLKALGVLSGDDRLTYWKISGLKLHCDASIVRLSYIRRADEADFPAYFKPCLITRLVAEFCLPLTENAVRADRLARLAEEELRLAKLIDSQQMERA